MDVDAVDFVDPRGLRLWPIPSEYSTPCIQSVADSMAPSILAVIRSPSTTLIAAVPFAPRSGQTLAAASITIKRTTTAATTTEVQKSPRLRRKRFQRDGLLLALPLSSFKETSGTSRSSVLP